MIEDTDSVGILPYVYGVAALAAAWCVVGVVLLVGASLASPEENSRWAYRDS